MKPNHLFTSMLVITTIVVMSCSAPRLAQQSAGDDDVYNTTAKARTYIPAPVKQPSQDTDQYDEGDYYGTSDPYYDQDYSSRINRFYYSSPWRTYYDPYYYSGWYDPYSSFLSFGYSPFYNNYWNSPFGGWGYLSSPFWGYGYGNYYGGGFFGGGYYGGGYYGSGYYGGGYYTGRTTNIPDYRSRPSIGRENGIGRGSVRPGVGSADSRPTRSNVNGSDNMVTRRSRAESYNSNGNGATRPVRYGDENTRPSRTETTRPPTESSRPTRTEPTRTERSTPPPAVRQPESRPVPTYTPPPRMESGGGSRGGGYGGGGGGGSAPSRGGRG